MALNFYSINKAFAGKMIPVASPRFGSFGRLPLVAEMLRNKPRREKPIEFTYAKDRLLVKAFEAVRHGMAPERVLWDDKLSNAFEDRARKLGLNAPTAQLRRRLLNVRKNKARYERHGIRLSETTVVDPHPSVVPQYAHAIEFALVKLHNRHGASIDDILFDPTLTLEYEKLASVVAQDLTSTDLRLAALYIRKTRYVARRELDLFDQLDADVIQRDFQEIGTAKTATAKDAPASEGLIEVLENDRFLYISRNENLRAVVGQFVTGDTLRLMANHFWSPKRESISIRILPGTSFHDTSVQRWQLKLIQAKSPLFNWPVAA